MGCPSERHSCSLTGLSTQDAFEFFQSRVVSFQRFLCPTQARSGSFEAQLLSVWLTQLSICFPADAEVCILAWFTRPQLPFFLPRPHIKVSTPAITFALLPVSIPGSQILLFLITSNWNDSQIIEQHF